MTNSNDLHVAFIAPLSTEEAVVAEPMLDAVRRGAQEASQRIGRSVSAVAYDDARDPQQAREAARRAVADMRTIGVVGPKNSGTAFAAVPVIAEAGSVALLPSTTADNLCQVGAGSAFRLCATDSATAQAAVELVLKLGAGSLAIIPDATDYGRGLAAALLAAARSAGMPTTECLTDADAAFHAMGEVEQSAAIRRARESGFEGVLLGAEGGPGAVLPELTGPAAEGAYQLYAGSVGAYETVYAAEAADGAAALVEALALARSRSGIRDALPQVAFEGASGQVAFEPDGERRTATVSVWRVVDGRCVPIAT